MLDREYWDGIRRKAERLEELQRIIGGELPERPRGEGHGSMPGDPTASQALYALTAKAKAEDELQRIAADVAEAGELIAHFSLCDVSESEDKAAVMGLYYIDRLSWRSVGYAISRHEKTAQAIRDRAIADMQAMGPQRIREHCSNPQKAV